VKLLPLLGSLALALTVIELVRRRRLREEFSWLWVVGASGALILSAWEGARAGLADLLGTDRQTAVLTVCLLFVVLVCLDISTKVSKLANQQKNLAQGLARMEKRLADLEGSPPGSDGGRGADREG
jgi:hypothetical protein